MREKKRPEQVDTKQFSKWNGTATAVKASSSSTPAKRRIDSDRPSEVSDGNSRSNPSKVYTSLASTPSKKDLLEARLIGNDGDSRGVIESSTTGGFNRSASPSAPDGSGSPQKKPKVDLATERKDGKKRERESTGQGTSSATADSLRQTRIVSLFGTGDRKSDGKEKPKEPEKDSAAEGGGRDGTAEVERVRQLEQLLREETTKREEAEAALAREREESDKRLEELHHLFEEEKRSIDRRKEREREQLMEAMAQLASLEREKARTEALQNSQRLGRIVSQRVGHRSFEAFEDGIELKRSAARLAHLKESIQSIEEEIKKSEGISQDSLSLEVLRVRHARLTEEYNDEARKREVLESEKEELIRELRRTREEDNCRFRLFDVVLHGRYMPLSLVGKGGFSEVYRAFDLKELRYVAVKVHEVNENWSDDRKLNYVRHATREYNIHKALNHSRVVALYDVFEIDNSSFATVLEFCEGGDLELYLKSKQRLPEAEARVIIAQIVSGLEYMNSQRKRIIHYDLKPGNILFNKGEIKITDFGLSKVVEEPSSDSLELTSQGAGTYWYLPPECFASTEGPPKISSKVDVWSVGVIFYQLLFGKRPFGEGESQESILAQGTMLRAKTVNFPSTPSISLTTKGFLRRCLTFDAKDRPDVLTLAKDPYLKL